MRKGKRNLRRCPLQTSCLTYDFFALYQNLKNGDDSLQWSGKPLVHVFEMSGLKLNRDELMVILYEVEVKLQEAITESIVDRIEFYTNLSIKLHNEMREIAERGL